MYEARINGDRELSVSLDHGEILLDGQPVQADVEQVGPRSFHFVYQGRSVTAHIIDLNKDEKKVTLSLNGKVSTVELTTEMDRLLKKMGLENMAAAKVAEIKAPMPGLIHSISVAAGDSVKKGDQVLILEAMKMENVIKSPADGVVARVHVEKGNNVDKGALMISFE